MDDERKGELQRKEQQRNLIHKHADDKIGHHDADDDDPAVEIHVRDHRNDMLRHPAECHEIPEDRRSDEDHKNHGRSADRHL